MIPYGKWNGIATEYILYIYDITPDFSQSLVFRTEPFNHSCLDILNLIVSYFR